MLATLLALASLPAAYAANFGSLAKSDSAESTAGYAQFSLLFWSADSNLTVDLALVLAPEGWQVDFPSTVSIAPGQGGEAIFNGESYVRATSAKIEVNHAYSKGSIIISASTRPQSGDIAFRQERVFNLSVEPPSGQISRSPIKDDQAQQSNIPWILIIAVIIIIFISLLIYKFS